VLVANIIESFPVVERIVAQAKAAVQQAGGKPIVFRRSFDFVTQDFPYAKNDKGEAVSLIGGGEVRPSVILAADNTALTAKDAGSEKLAPGPYRFCATIDILDKDGKTNALLTNPMDAKPGLLSLATTAAVTPDLSFTVPEVRGGDAIPQTYPGRTGAGVIVGIIDYGFDFAHPNFLKADGTSRLIALWDQNGTVNNGFDTVLDDLKPGGTSGSWYKSTGYSNSYIYTPGGRFDSGTNIWPAAPANKLDDLARSADPYTVYDPHKNYFSGLPTSTEVADEYGAHGTHIADICVGNGTATGRPGLAPEADIVFVQLPSPASDNGPADLANVLDAVHFIVKLADVKNQPAVVNICVNANSGPHNANEYYTSMLDKYVLGTSTSGTSKRVPIVVAAGNLFLVARDRVKLDKDPAVAPNAWIKKYRETMAQRLTLAANTADTFHWLIRKGDTTSNTLQLYYRVTGGLDNVSVTVSGRLLTAATQASPGGAIVPILSSNGVTPVGSIHARGALPGNDEPRLIKITIDPATFPNPAAHRLDDFLVKVAVTSVTPRTVHAFVERDGLNALHQSALAIFKDDLDTKLNGCTLGTLSCGAETIVVGAYFASDRTGQDAQIAEFSGAGPGLHYPTLDNPPGAGPQQPFVSAPGLLVRAARSKGGRPQPDPDHGFAVGMSGTSMAAPHVTGAIALMLAKKNNATPTEIKAALKASARPHPLVYRAWDSRLGHGRLDVKGALDKT
jgi:subtilisin family serine protease